MTLETKIAHKAGKKGAHWEVFGTRPVAAGEDHDVEFGDGTFGVDECEGKDAPNAGLARSSAAKKAAEFLAKGWRVDHIKVDVFRWERETFEWEGQTVVDAERVYETEQYGYLEDGQVAWGPVETYRAWS